MIGRVLATILVLMLPSSPALGVHAAHYRYVVLGYATDTGGRALSDLPITLVREKTGLVYRGKTDGRGFYVVVAGLGDEGVGEVLTLTLGSTVTRVVARFEPSNHTNERGTRVDLVGAAPLERHDRFATTLREFLDRP